MASPQHICFHAHRDCQTSISAKVTQQAAHQQSPWSKLPKAACTCSLTVHKLAYYAMGDQPDQQKHVRNAAKRPEGIYSTTLPQHRGCSTRERRESLQTAAKQCCHNCTSTCTILTTDVHAEHEPEVQRCNYRFDVHSRLASRSARIWHCVPPLKNKAAWQCTGLKHTIRVQT